MKLSKILTISLLIVGIAFSSGCTTGSYYWNKLFPVDSGQAIYWDDFSDSSSGWETWNHNGAGVAYETGGLRFMVHEQYFDQWSRPGQIFDDLKVEVLSTKLSGPDNNNFGLICRYQDDKNFYAFLISSDGYHGIIKATEGHYEIISGGELRYSEVVLQGDAPNYLQAECVGDQLSFFVNGEMMSNVQDSDFSKGDVGLFAGTYEGSSVDILFDNFVVYAP
ncbi:MAG: hypothetical protein JEZ06_13190 [Anaerolineaceae bacterium]|nr:hypothetical protein [Anaerolineaceae bacterium]